MSKRLGLITLIVLIAFIGLPFVSLSHDSDEVRYEHASDCPCSECKDKALLKSLESITDLLPGVAQARAVWNYLTKLGSRKPTPTYYQDLLPGPRYPQYPPHQYPQPNYH